MPPDRREMSVPQDLRARKGFRAFKEIPAQPGLPARKAFRVRRGRKGFRATRGQLALPVPKDQLALPDRPGPPVQLGRKVIRVRPARSGLPEQRVLKAMPARRELPDRKAALAQPVLLGPPERRARRETRASKAMWERLGQRGR